MIEIVTYGPPIERGGVRYVTYRGHEWREKLPLGKAGYLCVECGCVVMTAKNMPESGDCRPRYAPESWFGQEK